MSAHKSVKDLPQGGEMIAGGKIAGLKLIFLLMAVVGLGIVLFTMFFRDGDARDDIGDIASYSYLFAVTFGLTLGMGGLFWTILHHATNSGWGIAVRRQMENIMGLLPWVFVLTIPFWCPQVRQDLWEWEADAEALVKKAGKDVQDHLTAARAELAERSQEIQDQIKQREALLEKAETGGGMSAGDVAALEEQRSDFKAKLAAVEADQPDEKSVLKHLMKEENPLLAHKWFFFFKDAKLRLALYTLVFILMVLALRSWSIKNDKLAGDELFKRCRYWSCFFIIPFAVGYTFLAIDFLMTLDYKWFSTMWGVYLFAGAALNGMGLLVIVITWLRSKGYLKDVVTMEHYHLMGKLMLAFCVFWAYISFSQYFLIWYANIPEETVFFLLRNSGPWRESQHGSGGRPLLHPLHHFAVARHQKSAPTALHRSRLESGDARRRRLLDDRPRARPQLERDGRAQP